MALFPPSLPPILGSIENRYFEITSYLLSRGADPNAPIPAKSCSTILRTLNSKDNIKDLIISPLDVAIVKKDGRTVSTLITCGADVSKVDKSRLKPEILEQLNKYSNTKSVKDDNLELSLDEIRPKITSFDAETKKLIEEIEKITDFKHTEISGIVNKIRHHYVFASQVATAINKFAENLQKGRQNYLDFQFDLLVKDDQRVLEQQYKEDEKEWEALYQETIDIIEKKYAQNESKSFAIQCKKEIESSLKKFKNDKNDIFEPLSKYQDNGNEDNQSKRASLLYLNQLYALLRQMMETFCRLLDDFHKKSIQIVENYLAVMNDYLTTIQETKNESNFIGRIGFSNNVLKLIKEGNQPREKTISETQKQLEDQKKCCVDFYNSMKKVIMMYLV